MKKIFFMVSILLFAINVFAANGDLTVTGAINAGASGIKFSDGSTQTTAKRLVWDYTVTGTPVSSASTTLDANSHGGYEFEFLIVEPAGGSGVVYKAFYNNHTTPATDYKWTTHYAHTAGYASAYGNSEVFLLATNPQGSVSVLRGSINFYPSVGIVALYQAYRNANSLVYTYQHNCFYSGLSNLTNLDIVADVPNGIGINSRFRIWKNY